MNSFTTASLNFDPVLKLLQRHRQHLVPYEIEFRGWLLKLHPNVFNPSYTKVSGFLADHMEIPMGSRVLDMFTGSGALAFAASRFASHVVGVDISPVATECAKANVHHLGLESKVEIRTADVWQGVDPEEKFDVIIANPPLLPVTPDTLLEQAVADSPNMQTTQEFLRHCAQHMSDQGVVYMAFSNACQAYLRHPLQFISYQADQAGLTWHIKAEWDVGYEVYRILEFHKKDTYVRH
jgi:methylase of polypeptide subunit release factors